MEEYESGFECEFQLLTMLAEAEDLSVKKARIYPPTRRSRRIWRRLPSVTNSAKARLKSSREAVRNEKQQTRDHAQRIR